MVKEKNVTKKHEPANLSSTPDSGKIEISESNFIKFTHEKTGLSESTEFTFGQKLTISSEPIDSTLIEGFWFSYMERRCTTRNLRKWSHKKSKFFWTGHVEIWDYENCNISLARSSDYKLKVVIRRREEVESDFMDGKSVEIRRMIGFDLERIYKPKTDTYTARKNEGKREKIGNQKKRWVFQFNDNCWIWEWAKEGEDIESSDVYKLYERICHEIENPSESDNFFEAKDVEGARADFHNKIIPVIYQPAVDCLDNFLRIIHCAECKTSKGEKEIEVSLTFNNEQLRKNKHLNSIYAFYRYYRYGRTFDIETFRIRIGKTIDDDSLVFHNIYSGKYDLESDSIHGDSRKPARKHEIKYYFKNRNHPVIFINTSNHAMSEHDTNHNLWKWEYVPWIDKAPVKYEEKNRNEIEDMIEADISSEIDSKSELYKSFIEFMQKFRRVKRLAP